MNKELAVAVLRSLKEVEQAIGRLEKTVQDDSFFDLVRRDTLHTFRMGRTVGSLNVAENAVTQAIVYFASIHGLDYNDAEVQIDGK